MNTAINSVVRRSERSAFSVAKGVLLLAIFVLSIVGSVYFGAVTCRPVGLYMSIGIGALLFDPLRVWFRSQS